MLISIIVPIYNVEEYLDKCITSLLNQTYRNLEIILINDGSTDRSGSIIDSFMEKDRRIRGIHQKNKGVSATRNVGLQLAQGEYISFVDPDDYVDIQFIQRCVEKVRSGNYDLVEIRSVKKNKKHKLLWQYEKNADNSILIRGKKLGEWIMCLVQGNYYIESYGAVLGGI